MQSSVSAGRAWGREGEERGQGPTHMAPLLTRIAVFACLSAGGAVGDRVALRHPVCRPDVEGSAASRELGLDLRP